MISISDAVTHLCAAPAPVLLLDTCTFLDLFRRDDKRQQPRVRTEDIRAAAYFLQLLTGSPDAAYLFVPELVPGEFKDHADKIEREFERWLHFHDENQEWLAEAAPWVGVGLPNPLAVHPLGLHAGFRKLATDLLARAFVLARDRACLDRAVVRLIEKRRPSHTKEMKDSMNLEQCLELTAQLHRTGYGHPRVFVSSNTNDFADSATSSRLHPDLQAEFAAASLEYFSSLRAAVGSLRARGQLP
jgi:hypothetical protein